MGWDMESDSMFRMKHEHMQVGMQVELVDSTAWMNRDGRSPVDAHIPDKRNLRSAQTSQR